MGAKSATFGNAFWFLREKYFSLVDDFWGKA